MTAWPGFFRRNLAAALRVGIVLGLALVAIGGIGQSVRAEVTGDQVREAMRRGLNHLKRRQNPDGSWPDYGIDQDGGLTSLCTLAMLNSGVGLDDPAVARAMNWLRSHRLNSTYAVSLQTMVFCKADPVRDIELIKRNVKRLEETQSISHDKPGRGGWAYPRHDVDNSNSQFALLALHEAERAGAPVDDRTWQLAKVYWERAQNRDGSWGYREPMGPNRQEIGGTGSMTCAGIASMMIVNDEVHPPDATVIGDSIKCCNCTRRDDDNDRVERGLAWLERNFSISRNPGQTKNHWKFYYLYGVERVGRLSAQRFIGQHDWYREGADHLVNREIAGASYWIGEYLEKNDLVATSFALLFLSKGRRPVLIAKAKHPPRSDWCQHRSDVANLTRYVESKWKRDLTWQVVDLTYARVDDLIQSPVIYYAGKENPLPNGEAAQERLARNLRDFLDRGGFLLAEAHCGGKEFDKGFRELMKRVFPEQEYRLRVLDSNHPVWQAEVPIKGAQVRTLLGVEFGCRTSVIYAPPDPSDNSRPSLSCLWELARGRRAGQKKYPKAVQDQVDGGLALGINILAYATGRQLREKDDVPSTAEVASHDPLAGRGQLAIANLRHAGGCNAAPRAIVNLLERAAKDLKLRTVPEQREVGLTDKALTEYHLVFMHGRSAFRLTEAERKRFRLYVEQRGGMVFADSICANPAFTESFRREMAAIFPDHPLKPIPADDPILSTKFGGYDLSTVTRLDPQKGEGSEPMKLVRRKVPPTLEGIQLDGRWAVVFSPYDVSCALEKHNSLECQGYDRDDAANIALNVVLYSLQE
ncbi:MAG: DUF4159 domain-containing protein [Pirellulales bacterium]|nr:DUF4159 domain-containing protein [Pirellulales bacterium]